jgi:hypothetical protein
MPAQDDLLAALFRKAASTPALPATWRRDQGWLLAGAGVAYVSLGFAVRQTDAGAYVHVVRNARTESLIASLEAQRAAIERAFGGPLSWGAPRGRQRFQIYATLDSAGYGAPRRRWADSVAELVGAMLRLRAALGERLSLSDPVLAAVEASVRLRGARGASTAAQRLAVERHAVAAAVGAFRAERWTVTDVGASESYDLHCTRRESILRVEVKGTTGPPAVIALTANEVELARAHFPNTELFVVTDIRLGGTSGRPVTSGGTVHRVRPWQPEPERLRPVVYSYQLA